MSSGVLPMTLKQSERVLNGLVRHPLGRKKLKLQISLIKTMLIIFFRLSKRSAQRIRTRGKKQ